MYIKLYKSPPGTYVYEAGYITGVSYQLKDKN